MSTPVEMKVFVQVNSGKLVEVGVASGETLDETLFWLCELFSQLGEAFAGKAEQ